MTIPPELKQQIIDFFRASGATIAVVALSFLLYCLCSTGVKRLRENGLLPERMETTLRRVLRSLFIVLAVTLLLHVYGLLENVMAAIGGVMALVAIGFVAVWSVLSNVLCSLILLIARPFRVGDTLRLPPPEDLSGKVVNFTLLYTTLKLQDGTFAQIPNNLFFQKTIVRKPGDVKIGLGEQLYHEQNAQV